MDRSQSFGEKEADFKIIISIFASYNDNCGDNVAV